MQNLGLPSPGSVNDKIIDFFSHFYSGNGSPEGVKTAAVGAWYLDEQNGIIYTKQTGAGNTGWVEGGAQSGASVTSPVSALIASGAAVVANGLLPPGVRIARAGIYPTRVRVGTAPTGSALTVRLNVNGSANQSISVAAAATSQAGTDITFAAGDIVTFDITAIGSTTPGSDVMVDLG